MDDKNKTRVGLRERKRRETRDRVAEVGLRLFIENGYDATTLDTIAAEAGISRRSFFHHFKSKEDVLLAWQGSGFVEELRPAMLRESPDQIPISAAKNCLLKLASLYETKQSVVVDRLLRTNETLRARKEAVFVEMEQVMVEAMEQLWPNSSCSENLRSTAMMAMGTLRLAIERWRKENAERPLVDYLADGFARLEQQFSQRI